MSERVINIKDDGRCDCDYGSYCPLGRTGIALRCTEKELNVRGVKTRRLATVPKEDWCTPVVIKDGKVIPVESRACDIPPPGWRCTRPRGHEGPCAAVCDDMAGMLHPVGGTFRPKVELDIQAGEVSSRIFVHKGELVREVIRTVPAAFNQISLQLAWTKVNGELEVGTQYTYDEKSLFADVHEQRARRDVRRKFDEHLESA